MPRISVQMMIRGDVLKEIMVIQICDAGREYELNGFDSGYKEKFYLSLPRSQPSKLGHISNLFHLPYKII